MPGVFEQLARGATKGDSAQSYCLPQELGG